MLKRLLSIGVLFLLLNLFPISLSNETNQVNIVYVDDEGTALNVKINNGSLSGYVADLSMNPIDDVRVRVYFHETYEEDYTNSLGYYHVMNIPMCWCMKNATALKIGYYTEWILLSIDENTTYNFTLTSIDNNPPITPIITGFTEYKTGIGYEFCIENATDPEGHSMFVFWDWYDDTNDTWWYGPYDTGEDICAIHTWDEKGTYTIRAKLRDAYGAESDWGYLTVSMSKSKGFLDWPMTYGLLFGKIEDPYIEKNNDVEYLNFYASNVHFFYFTYGFGGLDFFFFDKIPGKNCRMSLGWRGSFYGFFNVDSIFGRYRGYYP